MQKIEGLNNNRVPRPNMANNTSVLERRVLVVEDNRLLAEVLRFNLERAGLKVDVIDDGQAAIEYLREHVVDLLITDYQMPGANGEEICRVLRNGEVASRMPIIVCSAKGLELDVDYLMQKYQVAAIIFKPFSAQELIETVIRLLSEEPCNVSV